ncbi:hypothetical protein GALL_362940 [mine drainage metagenome]|uniref:Uncharacterized protein n=1 Tax=mine drainage metagenome TaxID=410659 RepID=A0A1J5QEN8_9ZZZZ
MRELPTSDPVWAGGRPCRRNAVRGRFEDLDRVGAPERGSLAGLRQPCPNPLAGCRVPHEDDAAVVPGDAVSAVRDGPDLELDEGGVRRDVVDDGADPRGSPARGTACVPVVGTTVRPRAGGAVRAVSSHGRVLL